MVLDGTAAGHRRLMTSEDPSGTRVIGTVNDCAGGITPWGTYLMAEENIHGYFWGEKKGKPPADHPEANRFGWIVEVDPLDPASTPRKHTALGRFKHEGAEAIGNKDGRVVIYSGDDQRFDYLYKFVSHGRYDPNNRRANMDLLEAGILYVAKFGADGMVDWLPLVFGTRDLPPENGFESQADVLIETRRAADLLGATPMDRPEDVEPNPKNGKVYVMLTNNKRKPGKEDAANTRAKNIRGQIIEMVPPNGDHTSLVHKWEILVQAGNSANPKAKASRNKLTSENGWFSCPDNASVDSGGRLWISTDQGKNWAKASGTTDGLWALETEGPARGAGRMFFRVPGPRFTPDDKTLFLAVQHPATDGTKHFKGFARASTFEDPATRWPDFDPEMPPRPSIVVVTKKDGGTIGS